MEQAWVKLCLTDGCGLSKRSMPQHMLLNADPPRSDRRVKPTLYTITRCARRTWTISALGDVRNLVSLHGRIGEVLWTLLRCVLATLDTDGPHIESSR